MADARDVTVLDSLEALAWLEQSDGKERTISEDSETRLWPAEALGLVRELYAAGAVEVLVLDVYVEDEFEDASKLQVMLPEDPGARAALFGIEARALGEMGSPFDPEGEQGQQSFLLGW